MEDAKMLNFQKLKSVKVYRVYKDNHYIGGYFYHDEKNEALKLALKVGGRIVSEYITIHDEL
jgi:hypothetical protein